jgi:hypothetical protein
MQAMLPNRPATHFTFFEEEKTLTCVGGRRTSDSFFFCGGQLYDFKRFAQYVWSMHGIAVGYSINNGLVLMRLPSLRSGANYDKTVKFCKNNIAEAQLTHGLVTLRKYISDFDIFGYFKDESLPKGYVDQDSRFYNAETVDTALENMGYKVSSDNFTIVEILAEAG